MNDEDVTGVRMATVDAEDGGPPDLLPAKLHVASPGEVTAAGRLLWVEPKNNYVKATKGSLADHNLRQEVYPYDDTDIEDRGAARAWANRMLSAGWKLSEWRMQFGFGVVGFAVERAGKVAA